MDIKNIFIIGAIQPSLIAESIAKHSTKKNIGAHSIFLGQVHNDVIDGNEVSCIDYTYHEMAEEKFNEIKESVFEKYSLNCIHIFHSSWNSEYGRDKFMYYDFIKAQIRRN